MKKVVNENIILIGTAHVSKKSVAEVKHAIEKYRPEIVAVELDTKRYSALTRKRKWEKTSILEVIKSGKGFLLLVQTFLAMIQRKLGREFGVEPGAEMVAAIKTAKRYRLRVALVDRDITITFRRAWRLMTFREKMRLFWYSMKALIGYDRIDEELEQELAEKEKEMGKEKPKKAAGPPEATKAAVLEKLMDEDVISALMEELRAVVPNATKALIDERDQYISKKILGYVDGTEKRFVKYRKKPKKIIVRRKLRVKRRELSELREFGELRELGVKKGEKLRKRRVLAVVGAGHLNGIGENLRYPKNLPDLKTLEITPRKRVSILKVVGYLIPILFITLVLYLFLFGKWEMLVQVFLAWFLINGICSAIGAACALAHPLSIITAFFAAPLTSLNPAIGAGWVAGYVEVKVRSPTVTDIRSLSTIETLREFFGNKVVRVLMVMAFANLGSVVGTFLAGYYIGDLVLF